MKMIRMTLTNGRAVAVAAEHIRFVFEPVDKSGGHNSTVATDRTHYDVVQTVDQVVALCAAD